MSAHPFEIRTPAQASRPTGRSSCDKEDRTVLDANKSAVTAGGYVTELIYELLDAHVDTLRMAGDLEDDSAWAAHLDYMRDLQRVGREALAHASGMAG